MNNLDDYPLLTDETRKKLEDEIRSNPEQYQRPEAYFYDFPNVPDSFYKKVTSFYFPLMQYGVPYDKTDHREVTEDLENVKRIYGNMRDLPLSIASNFNFWSGLTHTVYWAYMQHRWPKRASSAMISRYLSKDHFQSRNGIARLWWLGYLTYREELENPWYYTEMMMTNSDSDLPRMVAESPTAGVNPKAVNAILLRVDYLQEEKWYAKIPHNKDTNIRRLFREYFIRYNMYGGVKAWSALNQEELNQQCNRYILDYLCDERYISSTDIQKIEREYQPVVPK